MEHAISFFDGNENDELAADFVIRLRRKIMRDDVIVDKHSLLDGTLPYVPQLPEKLASVGNEMFSMLISAMKNPRRNKISAQKNF